MKRTYWHAVAWALGVLLAGPISGARAQVGRGANLSRPTSSGASQRLGLLGGRYTYDWGSSGLSPAGQQSSRLDTNSARRVESRIGMVGGSYTATGPDRPAAELAAFSASQALGLSNRPPGQRGYEYANARLGPVYIPRGYGLFPGGSVGQGEMRYTSGFDTATRLDVPLEGWAYLNSLPSPGYPAAPKAVGTDRFTDYFGLRPARHKDTNAEPIKYESLYEAVERSTENHIALREEEALKLFHDVTRLDVEPSVRRDGLRRVVRLLSGVRDLDADKYLPCLLLGHVAMERGQVATAMNSLIVAARRDPELFRKGPALATYYGDYDEKTGRSEYLDGQMRNYLGALSEATTTNELVLHAYCALTLDDRLRARESLDKAFAQLRSGARNSEGLAGLIFAMQYGL